ncbi:cupin domain-containing protein [Bdellovibrio sp. 22V]|uniref:cupin domain-containing protein n=1 Tax=Bdellovibrio TaxID=958 RepID=UPI0025439708|nr:cupin domain-containing protein [Bdellovibrio sp. 22V]WII71070.1 cupin domain-containing protein [Bdellovibrio sp. 22V]
MTTEKKPFIKASAAPLRTTPSSYPPEFAKRVEKREKRPLGDLFGIKKFGVNLTTLLPGAESALLHRHTKQEEFVYVISGTPTLVLDKTEYLLSPGDCAGFAPSGEAHKLINKSSEPVVYLEMGDRISDDEAFYPEDDLQAVMGEDGKWKFQHKNGTPY